MVLTIGRTEVECESFRVRGAYSSTIARLFALPAAVSSKDPLTLEVTIKGNKFKPYKASRRVYWNKKHVGFFVLSNVAQEWDGDKYRTRLELKQCERSDVPDEDIPAYKWRHDLRALSENLPQTDGAKIEAGRTIDPFADSWKLGTTNVADASDDDISPAVLPVAQGGTGASDPAIAILNLGGISSASKGIAFGVAPLGADGKVPTAYLPPGSGGGGSSVVFPITVAQGGTNALDAATARTNLGAIGSAELTDGLALKADASAVASALALKADTLAVASALALKADASAVSTALALKLDTATFNTAIALKLDVSAFNSAIALKADTSALTAGLALKADATALTSGLALKVNNSAINVASGVAGLDSNTLILTAQIPLSVQFLKAARTSPAAVDLNALSQNHASVRFLDGDATHTNLPSGIAGGTLLQYDALFGVASGTVKTQVLATLTGRTFDRSQFTTWNAWLERCYLNKAQAFTSLQDFGASATFKGGGVPPVTTTMVQGGVDASGNPRYWLINASATTGNRLKSITVATNGNIQLRHHADDGTDGNVLEHTASGNILTNGTIRPGNGATSFTGASFVYGSTYFRTDITDQYPNGSVGNTLITTPGTLTVSNGERWVRVSDGTDPAKANKIIITGQLPASIAANTYTNFGTFNGVGKDFTEEVYLICVYLHFSDSSNLASGHWQIVGSTVASFILWKAGGTQTPVTFRMEEHNAADFTCSLRLAATNSNRAVQLAFDKALTFSVVANSYYRITFKRLI